MVGAVKQKFYIIAHNPNTVKDAEDYLKAGANALEPDICFDGDEPDQYFVSHSHVSTDPDSYAFTHEHSLAAYMLGLKDLILRNNFNLAMITFDYKDAPDGNINDLLKIVHDNFTVFSPICAGVAIMVTVPHASDSDFLTNYDQSIANVGVTIDQDDDCDKVKQTFVDAKQKRFGFGDGIMVAGVYPGIFKAIMKAKVLQALAASPEERFKLIHTWVLADSDSIRSYLDLHIDGIIVNLSTVPTLKSILLEKHYLPMYELAMNGYNPWGAPPMPQYGATVHTRDVTWAGTDSSVEFTLTGMYGSLVTTIDASYKGVLEQDSTDYVSFQGTNVGPLISMKVRLLQSGQASDWLPDQIIVEGNLLSAPAWFGFGPNDWVKFGSPVTKLAQPVPVSA